ncbi:trypsin-like serine protease [Clostridium botulinum]|uniref:trypsin-like serine protease n=1 Tax=Clostridium botulinum TaxID=1491 RepID=UPI0004D7C66E|nr:trypsin-like serine protease [Clostridium botulinum]KEI05433.1 hypothetical protein Z952_05160 [Clostridium botulinum C/D str. BKT75002]KEI09385.1 hypothetical protein Z954_12690 [Clostridium botulinum C/D str. BKT2873]MCD3349404.1 hypothetical protein [Clostridium botulinum D/C]MCD3358605.1 hypothetical protein [Clostridium botulinum D/C]MCD3364035.1 hypothetical protein [Clostridium botulinum D/C]
MKDKYNKCCQCCSKSFIDNKIAYICENKCDYFFDKANVVGVALGYKLTKGFYTSQKCITVFVSEKISENQVHPNDLIPKVYSGIITDVIQSGNFKAQGFTGKIRPVIGGYSIGSESFPITGTAGCLVTDKSYLYILGNNHILAYENKVSLKSKILQPGRADGGKSKDEVAVLWKYIPIEFKKKASNYVDCAMAKVLDKSKVSPAIAISGIPKGVNDPRMGEEVVKVGRSTELTRGVISNINASIQIDYTAGETTLKNQIITSKMSEVGDSGALLVDLNNYAIGLVVGSGENMSIHNPIVPVLERLGVRLVTK